MNPTIAGSVLEKQIAEWLANSGPTIQPPVVSEAVAEVGALAQWHREMAAHSRSRLDFDALWHAAALEARARDAVRAGQFGAATEDRLRAAEIILQAFKAAA